MKKISTIITIMLLLMGLVGCSVSNNFETRFERWGLSIHDDDFIEIYYDTLNVMFDNEWTVISREEIAGHNPDFLCGCLGLDMYIEYVEWTIEYLDSNGQARHFVLHNRREFATQVIDYVRNNIAEYYRENFVDIYYIDDVKLWPSIDVFVIIAQRPTDWRNEENQEWVRITDEFRNLLGTPEGAINLSRLTPANIFEVIPASLLIRFNFNRLASFEQPIEEAIMRRIEHIMDEINYYTNHQLTARVVFGYGGRSSLYLHTGYRFNHWHYIQGEQVFNISDRCAFERLVFESSKGIFW